MNTISSGKNTSLIHWMQNTNGSNIFEDCFDGNSLFLKDNYISFFKTLSDELKSKRLAKFIPLWKETLKSELDTVIDKLHSKVPSASDASLRLVAVKFQGNLAEIFAEKFFISGLGSDICKPESYIPVDPHHEEGIDASGISPVSGLNIGIQVKNYMSEKIGIQVFRTAGDESDKYCHTLNKDKFDDFIRCPNQYVFSFTDAEDCIKKSYENRVRILGPDYIESKNLCGIKGSNCGNWTLFNDIVSEISELDV